VLPAVVGAATNSRRPSYQRSPVLLRTTTAAATTTAGPATSDLQFCSDRPPPLLPAVAGAAPTGRFRCYQRPPTLLRIAAVAATRLPAAGGRLECLSTTVSALPQGRNRAAPGPSRRAASPHPSWSPPCCVLGVGGLILCVLDGGASTPVACSAASRWPPTAASQQRCSRRPAAAASPWRCPTVVSLQRCSRRPPHGGARRRPPCSDALAFCERERVACGEPVFGRGARRKPHEGGGVSGAVFRRWSGSWRSGEGEQGETEE
jgi:hypothetical protein